MKVIPNSHACEQSDIPDPDEYDHPPSFLAGTAAATGLLAKMGVAESCLGKSYSDMASDWLMDTFGPWPF